MTEASDGELERALAPSAAIGTLVPEPPAGEEPDSMLGGGVSPMGDTGPLAAYYSNGAMTVSFPAPKFRIKVPKGRKRPDSFYWEVASLFSIAAASGSRPAEHPQRDTTPRAADAATGTTWEVSVLLATVTGARRGEVLGLQWSNVDLDRGRVRIVEALQRVGGELVLTPPKTDRAQQEIPLPGFAVERLRAHKAAQARRRLELRGWGDLDLVCESGAGDPLDPDAFTQGFLRIAKAAGLEGVRLHDCRHGVATTLAKSGTPAYVTSKVLGHSSVHFTANTYTHADEETVDRALAGLEAAFDAR
jgi:integrase